MPSFPLPCGVWYGGSSAVPAFQAVMGTQTPATPFRRIAFDQTTEERVYTDFLMPANYVSGGTFLIAWYSAGTTNAVRWGIRIMAVPTTTTFLARAWDTSVEANYTNDGTANDLTISSLDVSAEMDGAAAGSLIHVQLSRIAANGGDTYAGDAFFRGARFAYVA